MSTLQKNLRHPKLGLIILAYIAFVALGMPDGILGIAWPSIRGTFKIPLDAMGLLLIMGTTGYLTSSFFSGKLIAMLGVGRILVSSCALTGAAIIGYTLVPEWWMMVALGLFSGFGAGAIDAGLNTYVAAHFNEGLMQWLHASYGIGITLGPMIMTYSLTSLNSWYPGYRIVGGFQLVMAILFVLTLRLWSQNDPTGQKDQLKRLTDYKTRLRDTLRESRVWLSLLLFFLYVGSEVSLGSWTYTLLTESRGIPAAQAGWWAGSFWATFTLGRIIAGLFARRMGVAKLVTGSLIIALSGTLLLLWNPAAWTNLAAIGLIGLAIAPIFPAMVSGTSQRVGNKHAANTIGMQMAIGGLGSALIPGALGILANRTTLEVIPVCLAILFSAQVVLFYLAMKKIELKSEIG